MKKFKNLIIILLIFTITITIFIYSKNINNTIQFSFSLWKENIFPSLFPFFVISSFLISIGFVEFLGNIFKNVMYFLFGVKGEVSFIFFMSMLSGFPSSAKYIEEMLNKKIINETDALKILMFTFFSNPLFVINTIGILFFNDIKVGIIILIAHYLGNIIIGILFRNYNKSIKTNSKIDLIKSIREFNYRINNTNLFKQLLNATTDSVKTLIMIFSTITLFLIIVSIISSLFKFNSLINGIISGIFEMTSGLKFLSVIKIEKKVKILISTFLISFGGLSIHAQIINILSKYQICYYKFFLVRILHGIISTIIIHFIFDFL